MSRKARSRSQGEERSTTAGEETAESFVRRKIPGEGIYEGQMVNGKRQGKGRLKTHTGFVKYEGAWHDDKRCGYGVTKTSQSLHEGNYVDDLYEGAGIVLWRDGERYSGYFRQGKLHGYGRYEWTNGDVYSGQWLDGQMTGSGFLSRGTSGDQLSGHFRNGQLHGLAMKQWGAGTYDKERYVGYFRDGVQSGYGEMLCMRTNNAMKVYLSSLHGNPKYGHMNSPYKSLHHLRHSVFRGLWQDNDIGRLGDHRGCFLEKSFYRALHFAHCYGEFVLPPGQRQLVQITWLAIAKESPNNGEDTQTDEDAVITPVTTTRELPPERYTGEAELSLTVSMTDDITLTTEDKDHITVQRAMAANYMYLTTLGHTTTYEKNVDFSVEIDELRYGRIDFDDGLFVYEGECHHYTSHGYGCLRIPEENWATAQRLLARRQIDEFLDELPNEDTDVELARSTLQLMPVEDVLRRLMGNDLDPHDLRSGRWSLQTVLMRWGGCWIGRFHNGRVVAGEGCLILADGQEIEDI